MRARENLMPIGRFARSCRLSVKALRHYDEQGLLKPTWVSAATGYRYYARGQARDAVLIGMLRTLGIGLAAIRAILSSDAATRQVALAREVQRLEQEVTHRQHALRAVQRLASAGSLLPYEIGVREEPPRTVARRSVTTSADHLVPDSTRLIYALFDELRAAGRAPLEPILCLNEEPTRDEEIVVHACAGVTTPWPTLTEARIVELPGGTVAWLTHRGSYEELGLAHHALHAWAQEHGHDQRDCMREIYGNDPADVAPEDLVTEVLLPI